MAALTITSARIPSGDAPICGVTLAPYVLVRRSDGQSCNGEDCPEEGSGDARFALRFRWYRSVVNKGGAVCFIHQVRCNVSEVCCAACSTRKVQHCLTVQDTLLQHTADCHQLAATFAP